MFTAVDCQDSDSTAIRETIHHVPRRRIRAPVYKGSFAMSSTILLHDPASKSRPDDDKFSSIVKQKIYRDVWTVSNP